ncbi:MAG: hypothetical protein M1815_002449 [Lichina confinis]|nr:MAG: hypothetical protein M1815_002449 [Lichina confinis]
MIAKSLAVALLAGAAVAAPFVEKRQATDPADFESAANQLISLYIPADAAEPINNAVESAAAEAGVTGDVSAIIQSALADPTPPAFLSAIPSEYQENVASLGSAISELRGVASTGIPGAPVVSIDDEGNAVPTSTLNAVETTDSAGSPIVAVTGPVTDEAGNTLTGVTSIIETMEGEPSEEPSPSEPTGGVVTTDEEGSTVTGLAATTVDDQGATITSLTTTFPAGEETDTIAPASETEGDSTTETATETASETETTSETETASETESETATETESETATETESETETASETETETQTEEEAAPTGEGNAAAGGPVAFGSGAGLLVGLVAFLAAL